MDIIYVDQDDKEIGSGTTLNAYENGVTVRLSRVFLVNKEGKLLIQKRSITHRALPGRWDQSAAGHVDAGETYEEAAYRELNEEMGIGGVKLKKLLTFYSEENDDKRFTKKRFNTIYAGSYDGEVKIDHDEVSDYKWVDIQELTTKMHEQPDNYTEGFILALEKYLSAVK